MANIRNSISMQDRMTPVFRSIIRSMDSTLRVMQRVDQQANRGTTSRAYRAAERDIRRANNELIRMQNNIRRADSDARNASNSMRGMASAAGGVSFNLVNFSAALYLLKNITGVLDRMVDKADDARSAVARLGLFNESQYTPQELYGEVYRTALATRTGLQETGGLVNRTLMSGALTGPGSAQAAIDFAGLINKTMVAGGGTAEENQRALLQLSQGLSSGVLQGDELRSIREQAPYLMTMLTKGLGKIDDKFKDITMGQLKQLGADGELTSDRIIKAMFAMRDEIDNSFKQMPRTFDQAMTQMGSMWQYFLFLLYEGDGALAKLNRKLWEFVDWLQTPAGMELIEGIALAFSAMVDAILWGADRIADAYKFLSENSEILEAAFLTLGIVAAGAAIKAAVAWIIAAWPILLVIALIGVLIYALLQAGVTAGQIIGGIAGGLMFLAYLLYDIVIGAIMAVGIVVVGAGMLVILVLQGIVQVILWVITTIWAALVTIYNVLYTIVRGAWGVIKGAIVAIYALFVGLGQGVLGILYAIAAAIDWVFGSNLADTVGGWMDGLGQSVEDLNNALDPLGEFEGIGDQWKNSFGDLGDMYAGKGQFDDWNITDNMGDVWNGGTGMIEGIWNWGEGAMANPMDGWDMGYKWGEGIGDGLANMNLDFLDNMTRGSMGAYDFNDVNIRGGDLDSVGKINSDVEIKDEDLKLLRDMAARDFLLNLQSITPVANVKFGDVRETADVNKIWDTIQDMVEEQMATSLVTN